MLENNVLVPILLSTISGLSTVVGAIFIFFIKNRSSRFLTFALGFSAGVMITVSFTDLFPTAEDALIKYLGKYNGLLWAVLFLIIGAFMAYLIDIFIPEEEKKALRSSNNNGALFRVGLISTIALMIHNFPEGIATFVSGYQDVTLGISIAIAISLHNIPEGLAVAMPIYFATKSKGKAIKYAFLSGMTEPIGAILAFLILKPFINELVLGIIFSIVCGIMLYISFGELLPSAQKYNHPRILLVSTFLGIVVMLITNLFS